MDSFDDAIALEQLEVILRQTTNNRAVITRAQQHRTIAGERREKLREQPVLANLPQLHCGITFGLHADIFVFYVDSKKQAENLQSYLNTRLFRFLVSLRKITQHATRATYTWIPQQSWDRLWTDEALYKKYGLSKADIAHIEASIRPRASDDE